MCQHREVAALLSAVPIQAGFPKKIIPLGCFSYFLLCGGSFCCGGFIPWIWKGRNLHGLSLVGFVTSQALRAVVTPRVGVSQCPETVQSHLGKLLQAGRVGKCPCVRGHRGFSRGVWQSLPVLGYKERFLGQALVACWALGAELCHLEILPNEITQITA